MSSQKNLLDIEELSEDKPVSERDYQTSALDILNGYCKINLEVPQIKLFYSSDHLLPINAKVNHSAINAIHENKNSSTLDCLADTFKNVVNLKSNENLENLDAKKCQSSSKVAANEFQVYLKPSYSGDNNCEPVTEKKDDKKRSVSPKSKKKKTKYNKINSDQDILSNQASCSSTNLHLEENNSTNYNNEYKHTDFRERLDDMVPNKLDLTIRRNLQIRNAKNFTNNVMKAQTSHSQQNTENMTQPDNLPLQSQCPLCFGLYPTVDIEVHASGCGI